MVISNRTDTHTVGAAKTAFLNPASLGKLIYYTHYGLKFHTDSSAWSDGIRMRSILILKN